MSILGALLSHAVSATGIRSIRKLQDLQNINLGFEDSVNAEEVQISKDAHFATKLQSLEQKRAISNNGQMIDAIDNAVNDLKKENDGVKKTENAVSDWGIYTYSYKDGKCDYFKSATLGDGQAIYRLNSDEDFKASVFVASGEVQRSKGDPVAIESCTGQALLDSHMKAKTFDKDSIFVVNHETNTIYNDIKKFSSKNMDEALSQFQKYPENDSTIIVRGKDGQIIKKKGEELYIAQNLAYLYNDKETESKI
jgi:hypothetical protein